MMSHSHLLSHQAVVMRKSCDADLAPGGSDGRDVAGSAGDLRTPELLAKSKAWVEYCESERPLAAAIRRLAS
jgi:hypothetical protein